MKKKLHILVGLTLIAFFFCPENAKAEIKIPTYDSTCCAPDSLRFITTECSTFCVSWKVPMDSVCLSPQGFEIQWRPLLGLVWKTKLITYTSGTTITFCDTVATCGVQVWRVRTICNDSTYSDWVNGGKFNVLCDCPMRPEAPRLSISPNPAASVIALSTNLLKPGPLQISIVNSAGKFVFIKVVNAKNSGQMREEISVSSWQRGIYWVSILSNGVVIRQGNFVKK